MAHCLGQNIPPWDDPTKMTLYHVQVETSDMLVSYEVLCEPGDASDIALDHFRKLVGDPEVHTWVGSCSSIGYAPKVAEPGLVTAWETIASARQP